MAQWLRRKRKSIDRGQGDETYRNHWAQVSPNPTQTERDELYHADAKRAGYFERFPMPPDAGTSSLKSLQDAIQGRDNRDDVRQPTENAPKDEPMIGLRVETVSSTGYIVGSFGPSGYVVGFDSGAWLHLDPFVAAQIIEDAEPTNGLVWIQTGSGKVEAVRGRNIITMEVRRTDGSMPALQWHPEDNGIPQGEMAVDEMPMPNPDEGRHPEPESGSGEIMLRALPTGGDRLGESQISHIVSIAHDVGVRLERVSVHPTGSDRESDQRPTNPDITQTDYFKRYYG